MEKQRAISWQSWKGVKWRTCPTGYQDLVGRKRGGRKGGGRGGEGKSYRSYGKTGTGSRIEKKGCKFMTKLKLQKSGQMTLFLNRW